LTDASGESFDERVAETQDISNLEAKLESVEQRFTIKMGGMVIVVVGVLTGLIRFDPWLVAGKGVQTMRI